MTQLFLKEISQILHPEQYTVEEKDLIPYSHDESALKGQKPRAVLFPATTEEVQKIVQLAYRNRVPITARGGGTGLEGSAIPTKDSIILDLKNMNRVLEIKTSDFQVQVEVGIIHQDLNQVLKKEGFFFAPSPGISSSRATIGGMISTNASGIHALRYGAVRENLLQVEGITGKGDRIQLGSRSFKSSSAYSLLPLICGSEGTLMILTQARLKLSVLPKDLVQSAWNFQSELQATRAVSSLLTHSLPLYALEFLDQDCIRSLNSYKNLQISPNPTVLVETQDSKTIQKRIAKIFSEFKGQPLKEFTDQLSKEEPKMNSWTLRNQCTDSIRLQAQNKQVIRNDIAFPISKLPEILKQAKDWAKQQKIPLYSFGHVGMGILHILILADSQNWKEASKLNRRIIEYNLSLGGSTSGEHGIGLGLKAYMKQEHGLSLEYMKAIKTLFDPRGILNPSKIFSESIINPSIHPKFPA